jgi:F-BAR domain only protein
LEAQYSAGLRKLAQRQLDGVDLGMFSVPWTTLTGSADTLADSHAQLAIKIETDVEQPLRNFASTNREMTQISTIQANLAALAKDVERAAQKTDKLRVRGDKAEPGKVATANSDLDSAQQQWETQAPYVFESLQSLDETRLNHLREALTQYQTHEVDQVERDKITAEQCLTVLLNVETSDEIKNFAQRAPQMRPSLPPSRSHRNSIATPSRSVQPPAASPGPSALQPTISQDDDLYTVPTTEEKQKGRFKGIRRLGTVMGRKRESKIPAGALPSTSESPERKQSRPSPFSSLSGRMGRSRDNAPTLDSLQESSPRQRPRSPLRLGSEIFQSPSDAARPEITTPIPGSSLSEPQAQVNGTSSTAAFAAGGAIAAGGAAVAAVPATLAVLNGGHQNDLADLAPPKPVEQQVQTPPVAGESQKDSEGFSVPPQNLDPISQAQQDAAALGDGPAPQFNVNIRDAPIKEDSADSSLADAANKLVCPLSTL